MHHRIMLCKLVPDNGFAGSCLAAISESREKTSELIISQIHRRALSDISLAGHIGQPVRQKDFLQLAGGKDYFKRIAFVCLRAYKALRQKARALRQAL
jgi:hypothetical protein